jgi:hypothetical protein
MHRRTPTTSTDAGTDEAIDGGRDTQQGSAEPNTIQDSQPALPDTPSKPVEVGGPKGPEPTRYGDWERNGRCSDF